MTKRLAKDLLQFLLLRKAFLWRLPPAAGRAVAFTFDDGPDPVFTPLVLEALARHRILATFFLVGKKALAAPELVRDVARAGHVIGNHSYQHIDYTSLSRRERRADWEEAQALLGRITGSRPTLFRPPRGKVDPGLLHLMRRLGQRLVLWSRSSQDYRRDGTEAIYARARGDALRAGEILLFHDHNPGTVEVVQRLIPELLAANFSFCTVDCP